MNLNVAAGLAYLPICFVNLIMSIIIIVTDKTNKFACFAAFQSLLLVGVLIVGYVLTMIVAVAGTARQFYDPFAVKPRDLASFHHRAARLFTYWLRYGLYG